MFSTRLRLSGVLNPGDYVEDLTKLTCSRSLGVYKVISLDAGVPSTANSNLSLPISSAVGTEVANYSPPTSATPTERNEYEVAIKDGAKDRHSYVIYAPDLSSLCSRESWYCRKRVHDIVDEALECSTEKSPAPTDPVAEVKPSPPVPARIAGSKRRFVDEQGAYSTSINPARKEPTFPCVLYFTAMYLKC